MAETEGGGKERKEARREGAKNTGKVVRFIDDVIVGMEEEEGHDEIVEEVVRRLVDNDLYVKPEKCKWKVREVGF